MPLTITSYNKTTEAQMKAYFDFLHNDTVDGRFVITFGKDCSYNLAGTPQYIKKNFIEVFDNYKYGNVFSTINSFNKFLNPTIKERDRRNLYRIDTLMFDLDAKSENTSGLEGQFMDCFLEYCKNNVLPVPNAFSYSGSGGIHLYYSIIPVYPGLKKAILALKYIMAKEFDRFVSEYYEDYGIEYQVDTKVFDDMRMDRVPGTMNPKTGRMCEFFSTNVPRYTFKLLLGYNEDIDNADWDKIARIAKKNFHYGKGKNTKIIFNKYLKKEESKKPVTLSPEEKEKYLKMKDDTMRNRISGIFKLAEMGYDFKGARETSCFALRQCCKNLNMSREEEIDLLKKLNGCFYEPFDEYFLINHTDSKKIYKMTNEKLAENLGLDINDKLFIEAFHPKTKTVLEYGLNKKSIPRAKCFMAVAQELIDDPLVTCKEILAHTGKEFTINQIKRTAATLRKNPQDWEIWANTTLDDSEFIYNYLSTHDSRYSEGYVPTKNNTVKKTNPVSENVVIYKKNGIIPSMGKKITISDDVVVPKTNVHSIVHKSENLLGSFAMLEKKSKMTDRNPRHKRVCEFYSLCRYYVDAYISLEHSFSSRELVEMMKTLNIPQYTADRIVNGYWKYSSEYIFDHSEKCFDGDTIPSCPDGDTNTLFNEEIKGYPEFEGVDLFKYNPIAIENTYYNNWELIDRCVPELYYRYFDKIRELKTQYRKYRNDYKTAKESWNPEESNRLVELGQDILNNIYECENDFSVKLEEARYSKFNLFEINKTILYKMMGSRK